MRIFTKKKYVFFSDLAIAHVPYKDSYDTTLDLSSHNIETFLGIGIWYKILKHIIIWPSMQRWQCPIYNYTVEKQTLFINFFVFTNCSLMVHSCIPSHAWSNRGSAMEIFTETIVGQLKSFKRPTFTGFGVVFRTKTTRVLLLVNRIVF